jgi:hypothetical protein
MPALPALILVGVLGTARIMDLGSKAMIGRVLTRSLAVSTLLVFVYFALLSGPAVYRREVRIINEEMVATAFWVQANIPPEDLLATHDIGALGYFAARPIVDIAGLISPEVVPYILNEDGLWDYLQASGARYLMALPSQVPGEAVDDPRLCRVYMSSGTASREVGGSNMSVYALEWDGDCNN